jgi:hypothetical protein
MILFFVALSIFVFNIPFGYWRANVIKYSFQWALAIHIPVPFIILLRIYSNIGFQLYTYPILVGAFFLGQISGKYLFTERKKINLSPITSCLVMDLYHSYSKG